MKHDVVIFNVVCVTVEASSCPRFLSVNQLQVAFVSIFALESDVTDDEYLAQGFCATGFLHE